MSELEKAIAQWDQHIEETEGHGEITSLILDAARRFASLTSPETIEKGAFDLWVYDSKATPENYATWNHLTEESQDFYRRIAEAVLRSVEEGKT